MASRYEVEVTIISAKDLKNVNWRHGPIKPYAVVWVDPKSKCATRVDEDGDTCPFWDQTILIPLYAPIEDTTLYIDIVHANAEQDTKPIIGSGHLPLHQVVDEVGLGEPLQRKIDLKRPSGRPHGKVDVRVCVREHRYCAPETAYYAPPYGAPAPVSRDYPTTQYYSSPYSQPPPPVPYTAAPPTGYLYSAPAYGGASYGQGSYGQEEKKSKFGMGTGLAVGAVAGVLGGVALVEGLDYAEDKIADDVADRVDDDAGYDDDDY